MDLPAFQSGQAFHLQSSGCFTLQRTAQGLIRQVMWSFEAHMAHVSVCCRWCVSLTLHSDLLLLLVAQARPVAGRSRNHVSIIRGCLSEAVCHLLRLESRSGVHCQGRMLIKFRQNCRASAHAVYVHIKSELDDQRSSDTEWT